MTHATNTSPTIPDGSFTRTSRFHAGALGHKIGLLRRAAVHVSRWLEPARGAGAGFPVPGIVAAVPGEWLRPMPAGA